MREEELARQRLAVLDAYLAAIERRAEVADVVASSTTRDEAAQRIAALLAVTPVQSEAILDLRFSRLSQESVRELRAERDLLDGLA